MSSLIGFRKLMLVGFFVVHGRNVFAEDDAMMPTGPNSIPVHVGTCCAVVPSRICTIMMTFQSQARFGLMFVCIFCIIKIELKLDIVFVWMTSFNRNCNFDLLHSSIKLDTRIVTLCAGFGKTCPSRSSLSGIDW